MFNELYLTELISVELLQMIQDAFSDMTGMAALTTDNRGVAVTNGSNFTDFCTYYTRKSALGCYRCNECDRKGAEISHERGSACYYDCHAGLVDYAAPIMVEGKIIGSFIGGQVLTKQPDFERVEQIAYELGINPEEYKEAIKKVKIVDKETVQKAADFLFIVSKVLSDIAYKNYKLIMSNIEIEKAMHMKGDFLANMSHEIRTPMNAVLGLVDLALREEMSPAAREYIQQIKASGKNLLVIINDILDFSKIESGKMEIVNISYEPLSIINDLASVVNNRIGSKDIEFTMDIAPDLPKCLFGDNIRIHQIILNLLTNAVKFTNRGEVHLKFGYELADNNTAVLKVSIRDTGIGIKPKDVKKLFNSFQQVDSKRNRNIEGTGLGLAITKQLLELMNGKIWLKSEYEKGSEFFFDLPQTIIDRSPSIPCIEKNIVSGILIGNRYLKEQVEKDLSRIGVEFVDFENLHMAVDFRVDYLIVEKDLYMQIPKEYITENTQMKYIVITEYDSENDIINPNVRIVRKPVYSLSLYNALGISDTNPFDSELNEYTFSFSAPDAYVLIVDDNPTNLIVAKGLIEPLKMHVDTATSAEIAIDKLHKIKYDIIFMDHMMPEVDGIEATHIIKRLIPEYKDVPIIALTANAISGAEEMFISEGMSDFVAKPIDINDITLKIRKWLPEEKIIADKVSAKTAVPDYVNLDISELNIKDALALMGNPQLLHTVIKEYYNSIDKKSCAIEEYKNEEKWKEYTIEVHALKSLSRQVGADNISKLAAELEQAGNEGNIDLINEKNDLLLSEYRRYKEILAPYFPETKTAETISNEITPDMISQMLDRLKDALDNFDILQIDEVIEEMSGYQYSDSEKEIFDKLKEVAELNDVEACVEIVDEWKNLIPN